MQFIGSSGDQEDVVNAAVRAATDYIAEALSGTPWSRRRTPPAQVHRLVGQDDPPRRAHVDSVLADLLPRLTGHRRMRELLASMAGV
ncbi:hypothetical protein [Streptomyces sp. NPDC099088]|uniref:hypothetical protein n=1 Tax=Streptomyces sp. NPDC099088 TaxID=3366101 RepID=UPI0038117FC3